MTESLLVAIAALLAGTVIMVLLLRARTDGLGDEQFAQLAEQVQTELAEAQSQALQRNSEQFLELAETQSEELRPVLDSRAALFSENYG